MEPSDEGRSAEQGLGRAAGADLSTVAAEVRALLAAAEDAAVAIKQEAEAEVLAATEGRSRLRSAAFDLGRLSAQAEALSLQADALRAQGDAIRDRLDAELDGDAAAPARPASPSAGGREGEAASPPNPAPGAGSAGPFPRSRTRIEAHRMRLAGARRDEVRALLERRAAADVDALLSELFDGRAGEGEHE